MTLLATTRAAPRARPPSRAAFTLIEVLLALAIFAGVLVAIYSAWSAILRGAKTAQEAAESVQRRRIAVRALEEALVCAQLFAGNVRQYGFVADTDDEDAYLSFVAHLPAWYPRSGRFADLPVRRVEFQVEPDPEQGGKRLVLRQNPLLFEPDVDEQENPLVLARHVAGFRLAFYNANTRQWQPEWRLTNQIPRVVQFTLATYGSEQARGDTPREVSRVIVMPAGGTPVAMPGAATARPGGQPPRGTNAPAPVPGPEPGARRRPSN